MSQDNRLTREPTTSFHARRGNTCPGKRRVQRLLDLELSVGSEPRRHRAGQPLLDDDRGSPSRDGRSGRRSNTPRRCSSRESRGRSSCFTCRSCRFQTVVGEVSGTAGRSSTSESTRPGSGCRSTSACSPTRTHSWSSASITWSPSRRQIPRRSKRCREFLKREGTCLILGPHHDVGVSTDHARAGRWNTRITAIRSFPGSSASASTRDRLMKGLGVPVENRYGLRPATVDGTNRAGSALRREGSRHAAVGSMASRHSSFIMHLPHYARDHGQIRRRSTCWRGSRSTCPGRIRSPRPGTGSSTCSSGCLRAATVLETSCWRTPPSSRRCSAATRASSVSGRTSPPGDGAAGQLVLSVASSARSARRARRRRTAASIRSA